MDLIGSEVSLNLLCEPQPRLGHTYQQRPVFGAGGVLVCNPQAFQGMTPVLVHCHEFARYFPNVRTPIPGYSKANRFRKRLSIRNHKRVAQIQNSRKAD